MGGVYMVDTGVFITHISFFFEIRSVHERGA